MAGSHRRRLRPAGALAAAALAALVWATGSRAQPPLRDTAVAGGTYRYCQAQAGSGAPAASQINHNIIVLDGVSPAIDDRTAETPPQVELHAPAAAFTLPPRTSTITVTILCAPPPAMLPADGPLDGNVYDVGVAAGGVALTPRTGAQLTVVLRGPPGVPNPVIEQFANGIWSRLPAQSVSGGESAVVTQLGTVALVAATTVVQVASGSDHTGLIIAVTLVAVVLFVAGVAVALRGRYG